MRPRNREGADHDLAREVARLWPHRKHQSPALTCFLCCLGMHYWRSLALGDLYPRKYSTTVSGAPRCALTGRS